MASRKFGNTSASSLMKAAKSAYTQQATLQDSIAGYQYDLSAKTQSDLNNYLSHLNKQLGYYQNSDPVKTLDYQKKITSAQRSYTSAEIGRSTTQKYYGNATNQDKLNTMVNLYQQAIANGDENLAQSIESKAAVLQSQMLNSGGGSGGGSSTSTPYTKGLDNQLNKVNMGLKQAQDYFNSGQISQSEYMTKVANALDQKDQLLNSLYTENPADGSIKVNNNLDIPEAKLNEYAKQHLDLLNSGEYKSFLGENNAPIEQRIARQQSFNTIQYDPVTQEYKSTPNNIVGIRPANEFMSTMQMGINDNNPNNQKYADAFKKLGINDNVSKGILKDKGFIDLNGNNVKGDFYLNDPNNPKYAYTVTQNGTRLALLPNGHVQGLQDSKAASDQLAALQDRLANPNISQQEKDAITNDIKNVDTNYIPENIQLNSMGVGARLGAEWNGYIKPRLGAEWNRDIKPIGNFMQSVQNNALGQRLHSLAMQSGGNGAISGALNNLSKFSGLDNLSKIATGLQQKVDAKNQADAAQQASEFAANQQAIQQATDAQKAYQAQVAAQNWQNVAKPFSDTPAGQAAANIIGSPTFNSKNLGGIGNLYNNFMGN